jgi:rare lipoprotein A
MNRGPNLQLVLAAVALVLAAGCATTSPLPRPAASPASTETLHGVASWYGEEFAGRTTANGEIFDPLLLTAAHRTLPFGTVLDVRNAKTSQTVRVRVNDRGPFIAERLIDLSYGAAKQIGLIDAGTGDVDLTIVSLGRGDREPPAPLDVTIASAAPAPKPTSTASDVPKVDFPLPTEVIARQSPTAPANPPPPSTAAVSAEKEDPDFTIQVVEERKGVEMRRQVSADGRTVENVPVSGGKPSAAPASNDAPASGGQSSAAVQSRAHQEAASTRPHLPTGFFVQVGAFSVEANAKALQDRLIRIGQQSHLDHDELYRVRIGPFATRDEAVKQRTTLEANGISAIVVTP